MDFRATRPAFKNAMEERGIDLSEATRQEMRSYVDTITAAQAAGASDADLAEARELHRRASLRWDFVSSENSTGFHSPQESARILANALDYARRAELAAARVKPR